MIFYQYINKNLYIVNSLNYCLKLFNFHKFYLIINSNNHLINQYLPLKYFKNSKQNLSKYLIKLPTSFISAKLSKLIMNYFSNKYKIRVLSHL